MTRAYNGSTPDQWRVRHDSLDESFEKETLSVPDLDANPSRSCDETSSLEDDHLSPRVGRRSYYSENEAYSSTGTQGSFNVLPPLHPNTSAQPLRGSRHGRNPSSDTIHSNASSHVSVDAGKHGFVVHDDASSTGSLVLAYQPGKEVPPAEYDLPKSIIGVYGDRNGTGEASNTLRQQSDLSEMDDQDLNILPYHLRKKINSSSNLAQLEDENQQLSDSPGWEEAQHNMGYGAMEAGLVQHLNMGYENTFVRAPTPPNYDTTSSLCYSEQGSEIGPYPNFRGSYNNHNNGSNGAIFAYNMQQSSHVGGNSYQSGDTSPIPEEKPQKGQQFTTYIFMLVALIVFVALIYGLFFIMKFMP